MLHDPNLGDAGSIFATALKENTVLTEFTFLSNDISKLGMQAFLAVLETNTVLTRLNFGGEGRCIFRSYLRCSANSHLASMLEGFPTYIIGESDGLSRESFINDIMSQNVYFLKNQALLQDIDAKLSRNQLFKDICMEVQQKLITKQVEMSVDDQRDTLQAALVSLSDAISMKHPFALALRDDVQLRLSWLLVETAKQARKKIDKQKIDIAQTQQKQKIIDKKLSEFAKEKQQLSKQPGTSEPSEILTNLEEKISQLTAQKNQHDKQLKAQEAILSILKDSYQLAKAKEGQIIAIKNQPRLKAFFNNFKAFLTNELVGNKSIAGERVKHTGSKVDDGATILSAAGSLLSLPLVSGAFKSTASGIEFVNSKKQQKRAKRVAALAPGVDDVEDLVSTTARYFTLRYQGPLNRLMRDKNCAVCAKYVIHLIIEAARAGKFSKHGNIAALNAAFSQAVLVSPSSAEALSGKVPGLRNRLTLADKTEIAVYEFWCKPGIRVENINGQYEHYGDLDLKKTDHMKLGFRLGGQSDISKLSLKKVVNITLPSNWIPLSLGLHKAVLVSSSPTASTSTQTTPGLRTVAKGQGQNEEIQSEQVQVTSTLLSQKPSNSKINKKIKTPMDSIWHQQNRINALEDKVQQLEKENKVLRQEHEQFKTKLNRLETFMDSQNQLISQVSISRVTLLSASAEQEMPNDNADQHALN